MRKGNIKIKAKEDFGTWLEKGIIVEVTETWALFALDKNYAELLKGEARKLRGVSLLKKWGVPPFKPSYSRKLVIELLLKLDDAEKIKTP